MDFGVGDDDDCCFGYDPERKMGIHGYWILMASLARKDGNQENLEMSSVLYGRATWRRRLPFHYARAET